MVVVDVTGNPEGGGFAGFVSYGCDWLEESGHCYWVEMLILSMSLIKLIFVLVMKNEKFN